MGAHGMPWGMTVAKGPVGAWCPDMARGDPPHRVTGNQPYCAEHSAARKRFADRKAKRKQRGQQHAEIYEPPPLSDTSRMQAERELLGGVFPELDDIGSRLRRQAELLRQYSRIMPERPRRVIEQVARQIEIQATRLTSLRVDE